MKKCIRLPLTLLLVLSFIFASCSSKEVKNVLRVGTPMHNGIYNPLYASTVEDRDVCSLIFEGLVTLAPDGIAKANDRLVKKLDISPDGLTYTFILNEGMTFSDGTPMTVEDVLFTYKSLAAPSSTAWRKDHLTRLKGGLAYISGRSTDFTSVKIVDKNTVSFNFIKKDRTNLEVCGVEILSKNYYPELNTENVDIEMQMKMRMPMGSGPYVLNKVVEGKEILLVRNPNYWAVDRTNYLLDEILIKFYHKSELVNAMKSDEIDLIPEVFHREMLSEINLWQTSLGDNPTVTIDNYDSNSYGYIGFNTSIWYSKSSSMRKAVAYGFNRKKFVEDYFVTSGEAINASMPSSSALYKLIAGDLEPYNYDPEKAREILASVNYTWEDDGKLYFEGEPVTLNFLATVNSPVLEAMMPQFVEDMKALGIEVIVEYHSYDDIYNMLRDPEGTWNLYFMEDSWHADDPYYWESYFSSISIPQTNVTRYNNPEVNGLLIKGIINENPLSGETLKIYKAVLKHLNQDLPELPIYTKKINFAYSQKVKGLDIESYRTWAEGIEGVSIEQTNDKK